MKTANIKKEQEILLYADAMKISNPLGTKEIEAVITEYLGKL